MKSNAGISIRLESSIIVVFYRQPCNKWQIKNDITFSPFSNLSNRV